MSSMLTSWLWNRKRSRAVSIMLLVVSFVLTSGVVPVRSSGMASGEPQQSSQVISGQISEFADGEKAYQSGKFESALVLWEQAEKKYRSLNDADGIVQSRIYQSQALKALGFYARACDVIVSSIPSLDREVSCSSLDREVSWNGQNTTHWKILSNVLDQSKTPYKETIWYGLGENLRSLGDLEKSKEALKKISKNVNGTQDAAKNLSLANTLRALGNLERDRQSDALHRYQPWSYTDQSWQQQKKKIESATRFYQESEEHYQSVIRSTSAPERIKLQTRTNYFSLLVEIGNIKAAQEIWNEINPDGKPLEQLEFPNNLFGIYTQINLAKNLAYVKQALAPNDASWSNVPKWQEIISTLKDSALQKAQQLNSNRAKSQVLGNLGSLYEYCDKSPNHCDEKDASSLYRRAKENTEQALFLAQPSEMPDIAYQWQWQLGRLYKPDKDKTGRDLGKAIAFYQSAVKTLESNRSSLVSTHTDVQFSFRDNLEPVYRDLVNLLLLTDKDGASPANRKKALYYVEALQVAELENSLRCNLRNLGATANLSGSVKDPISSILELVERILKAEQDAKQPRKAAFLYPIVLENQLAILLKLPKKDLIYQSVSLDPSTFKMIISEARKNLTKGVLTDADKEPLITLYQWLIEPVAKTLEGNHVQKLIFVLDSALREIPMAALYDGSQYLVEKNYSIAISPSIQLLKPKASIEKISKLLVAASTKNLPNINSVSANESSKILEQVNSQINAISESFNHPTILFRKHSQGKPFTSETLRDSLINQQYDAIHIVAHGQFSSNPQKTMIATEDPEQPTININKFGEILKSGTVKQALQLLVLSSCKTAGGDNRSVLGIAGMAIRSDATGTIAPLWAVNQEATTFFIKQFYKNLTEKKMSKEDALKSAQKALLTNTEEPSWEDPYYWAAFILVGN
jgi:CHAT domain-containing protein